MSLENEKIYQIRYNTNSTNDSNRWRLICDGQEILVADIIINSQTYTTKDYIEGLGDKWHITCRGELTIENNVAHINFKKDNAIARHLAKTITWRILGSIDTMIISWFITGNLKMGLAIGGVEVLTKMILYFLHERAWWKFGKISR
jgi:uncharacterized membrane protein